MRGSIVKRGSVYYVMVELPRDPVSGKRRQLKRAISEDKGEAEKALTRILSELDSGRMAAVRITVASYLERWLATTAERVSPRTHERYEEIVRLHLIPAFGKLLLSKLTARHLSRYYSQALLSGRVDGRGGLKAQTVHHHHRCLYTALRQAVRQHLIPYNVADEVDAPRPQRSQVESLDIDGAARLLEAAREDKWFVAILLALTTGMRRGEIVGLQWRDIDFSTGSIMVRRSVQLHDRSLSIKATKRGGGRLVALDAPVLESLKQYREDRGLPPADTHVFTSESGEMLDPNSLTRAVRRIRQRTGIQVHFHALRHSHATLLLLGGVHPKVVSERLGHSSVAITLDIYSHVLPGMQAEAAKMLSGMLGLDKRGDKKGEQSGSGDQNGDQNTDEAID